MRLIPNNTDHYPWDNFAG